MHPKSAWAVSWFALILNSLGVIATALSAQFMFSVFAAILALIPAFFARKRAQIFGVAVLVVSLALVLTGYPKYEQDPYMQRARAKSGDVLAPLPDTQKECK
jgi:membrane protein implicated in regulation of membrane protease activity